MVAAACSGGSRPGDDANAAGRGADGTAASVTPTAGDATTSSTSTTSTTTSTPTAAVTAPVTGTPGGEGLGDPYFPEAGNEGYDLTTVDLDLRWAPDGSGGGRLDGIATITATASRDLSAFNLDLRGLTVTAVTVDGEPAAARHADPELSITPVRALRAGTAFRTVVTYGGTPQPVDARIGVDGPVGWITTPEVAYVASEPIGASTWFPANDHPLDKATYRLRVTAPDGLTVAANGLLRDRAPAAAGTTVWTYEAADPLAAHLVTVAIGRLRLEEPTLVDGGGGRPVVLRNVVPEDAPAGGGAAFEPTAAALGVLAELFGPYPFEAYGALVVPDLLGYALENQTLSLFGREALANPAAASIAVHELAHQWFGNAVSPASWRDIWLNEGWATYAESLWAERSDPTFDIDAAMARIASRGFAPPGDPGRAAMFDASVYQRGALTLHALRRTIGDDAFFRLARTWVARHSGSAASTAQFVALASEVAGRDLGEFFRAWLTDPATPPLPG